MKKAQCKETVETYRKFLTRQEGVHRYLKLAEVRRRGEPFVVSPLSSRGEERRGGGGDSL